MKPPLYSPRDLGTIRYCDGIVLQFPPNGGKGMWHTMRFPCGGTTPSETYRMVKDVVLNTLMVKRPHDKRHLIAAYSERNALPSEEEVRITIAEDVWAAGMEWEPYDAA